MGGVYRIVNKSNGHAYVGSSVDVTKRMGKHRGALGAGKHPNRHLQNAWNKYGGDTFSFEVLEVIDVPQRLVEREQAWIDKYPWEALYNLSPTAGNTLGVRLSDEARAKISFKKKGKRLPPASEVRKARISIANKGKKRSAEYKARRSIEMMGRPCPDGVKAKLKDHYQMLPPEARQQILTNLEKGRTLPAERRAEISRACVPTKPVQQIDLQSGEVIATYCSAVEAGGVVGRVHSAIANAATGYSKSCAGYGWRYVEKE